MLRGFIEKRKKGDAVRLVAQASRVPFSSDPSLHTSIGAAMTTEPATKRVCRQLTSCPLWASIPSPSLPRFGPRTRSFP